MHARLIPHEANYIKKIKIKIKKKQKNTKKTQNKTKRKKLLNHGDIPSFTSCNVAKCRFQALREKLVFSCYEK